jgi:hypothetical protein
MGKINKKNGLIAALLQVSKPTRKRTVIGLSKDKTLKSDCPKSLVSGETVIIIPRKADLRDVGGLMFDSTDRKVKMDAMNHPAYLCSDALHVLEAMQTKIVRDMGHSTIRTEFDRIFPESEEAEFLKRCNTMRNEFDLARDVFFTHYDEMVTFWAKATKKKWGYKWGDLVRDHAPSLIDIVSKFRFTGETRDISLRSSDVNESEFVSYLFDDLVTTVECWNLNANKKGRIDSNLINELKRNTLPKLERYEFLDKRVKPINSIATGSFDKALAFVKDKTVCPDGFLSGQHLADFNSAIKLLSSSHSLHAIQCANIDVKLVDKPQVKVSKIDKPKLTVTPEIMNKRNALLDKFKTGISIAS